MNSRTAVGLDGLVENAVEALDKCGGIFECDAFHQQSLIEEQPRSVGHPCVLWVGEKFLDDLSSSVTTGRSMDEIAGQTTVKTKRRASKHPR